MKIAVLSTPIFPLTKQGLTGYGGLEHIAWQQASGLAARGHDVLFFAPDGSECPGATVYQIGPAGQIDEKMAFGGFRELKQGDQVIRRASQGYWQALLDRDVICDHTWSKWSYSLKIEGTLKAPVLSWMHAPVDTMFRTLPAVEKPCIVCISEDQRNHFEALFSRPARVCKNGIDLNFYKPLGLPRTKRFLFLARFSSVKSPDLAIQACQEAGVELDLVGDTKLTGEAEYLKSILGMVDGERIRFVGPATRSECVYWFSRAYCLIHPIKNFREPLGLAPIEAMACDCPVIAWDNGALRETVKDGRTGRLVSSMEALGEAIRYSCFPDPVWDGEKAADTWRKHCREWASQFSVERMVVRAEELCQEALQTGGW